MIKGTSTTGTTSGNNANMSTEELIKSMEELKLQVIELKQVKEKLAKAERNYEISKISVVEKIREIKALENKIKALEKDLTFDKHLAEIKKILWTKFTQSMNDVWPSIQVIYEQMDLVKATHGTIQQARAQLREMPEQANWLIYFLNTKNKE